MNPKVAEWLFGDDTGLSSRTMVAVMENIKSTRYDYPLDPADLGRYIRLLLIAPEYRVRLGEMKRCGPKWSALVDHWDELERLYYSEYLTGRAPKCFDRMQELLYPDEWAREMQRRAAAPSVRS